MVLGQREMFNGLIKEIATVKSYENNILTLRAKHRPNLGASIAVNGACLSVIKLFDDGFSLELSFESRRNLAVENFKGRVHIEPAMRLMDAVDGHLIQGHIDGIATIRKVAKVENGTDFYLELPKELMPLMANKGSVGVDGVSLTINEVIDSLSQIRLTIIPITLKETLFGEYKVGRRANIESDLLARYVERVAKYKENSWQKIDQILATY